MVSLLFVDRGCHGNRVAIPIGGGRGRGMWSEVEEKMCFVKICHIGEGVENEPAAALFFSSIMQIIIQDLKCFIYLGLGLKLSVFRSWRQCFPPVNQPSTNQQCSLGFLLSRSGTNEQNGVSLPAWSRSAGFTSQPPGRLFVSCLQFLWGASLVCFLWRLADRSENVEACFGFYFRNDRENPKTQSRIVSVNDSTDLINLFKLYVFWITDWCVK